MGFPGARRRASRQPWPSPCLVPAAAPNAAFLARLQELFPPRRLCNVWKGGTPARPVGVCWGRRALCLPTRLPGSPHIPAWPVSLFAFTSVVDAGSLSVLAPLRPTSFYRPVVLSPRASATPSGFGGPGSAPSSDSKADTGPSCCWKGNSVGSGWLFSIFFQNEKKKKKLFFFCFFKTLHCAGPSPTVSCGQSRSALQALGGWG